MKKSYIFLSILSIILIFGIATYKQEKKYSVNTKVDIPVMEYDFGEITYLDTINYTFQIKNIGKESLIITKVIPNCTCTLLDFNTGIIRADETSEIKVQFIPNKARLGVNNASILVEGNFNDGVTHLQIKGKVKDVD